MAWAGTIFYGATVIASHKFLDSIEWHGHWARRSVYVVILITIACFLFWILYTYVREQLKLKDVGAILVDMYSEALLAYCSGKRVYTAKDFELPPIDQNLYISRRTTPQVIYYQYIKAESQFLTPMYEPAKILKNAQLYLMIIFFIASLIDVAVVIYNP